MKRFSLGLAAIGLLTSLGVYAAMPTNAAPFEVKIPNFAPGWEFNLTGLYLRPSTSDEDYTVVTNEAPVTATTYEVKTMDPDFDWAIGVGIGYIFPDSGNDVRLSWLHFFEHTTTDSTQVDEVGSLFVGPTFDVDFDPLYDTASGTEEFKYDAVDLNVGQFVDLGTRLELRLFGGLRYAHIERDFDTNQEQLASFDDTFLTTENNSEFDGIGPLFGVDSSYHLGGCWGLVGHFDTVLLVGDVKSSDTLTTADLGDTVGVYTYTYTTTTTDDITRVVPGFDAKLGLDWSMPFECDSWLSVELGYQVTKYIDVFDRHQPAEVDSGTDPVTFDASERVTSDFAFDGPYLSLNLKV